MQMETYANTIECQLMRVKMLHLLNWGTLYITSSPQIHIEGHSSLANFLIIPKTFAIKDELPWDSLKQVLMLHWTLWEIYIFCIRVTRECLNKTHAYPGILRERKLCPNLWRSKKQRGKHSQSKTYFLWRKP